MKLKITLYRHDPPEIRIRLNPIFEFFKMSARLIDDKALEKIGFELEEDGKPHFLFHQLDGFRHLEAHKNDFGYYLAISYGPRRDERINIGQYFYVSEIKKVVKALRNGR